MDYSISHIHTALTYGINSWSLCSSIYSLPVSPVLTFYFFVIEFHIIFQELNPMKQKMSAENGVVSEVNRDRECIIVVCLVCGTDGTFTIFRLAINFRLFLYFCTRYDITDDDTAEKLWWLLLPLWPVYRSRYPHPPTILMSSSLAYSLWDYFLCSSTLRHRYRSMCISEQVYCWPNT